MSKKVSPIRPGNPFAKRLEELGIERTKLIGAMQELQNRLGLVQQELIKTDGRIEEVTRLLPPDEVVK